MPLPFRRRHHRPGTAPGTLHPPEVPRTDTVEITVLRYTETEVTESRVVSADELAELVDHAPSTEPGAHPAPRAVTWIDVTGLHDVELLGEIGRRFGLHPLALEDVVNTGQRPKAEDYEGSLFLVLRHFHLVPAPESGSEEAVIPAVHAEQIALFLLPGTVITFQEIPGDAFDPVRERLRRGGSRLRTRGADYLAYALLDALVDGFFPLLETMGARLEDLEDDLIADPAAERLEEVHRLRRELLALRRTVWPERELIASLYRGESPLMGEETRVFLRDCHDHAVEALEVVETYRELASGMVEMYLSSVSQRMNEVMKVLTIIATLFIPLTFIAGIYGMNFEHMPELGWRWGYPASLGIMAAVAVALLIYFRRKGWL